MGNGSSFMKYVSNKVFGHKEVRILMCGLDAAGKTAILYKLKLGEIVTTIPTIGFNVETVEYKNVSFTSWDVGGRDKTRVLVRHYYQNTDALMYVIDSNDRERLDECRDELRRFFAEDELKDCVVLVMANKQDLPNAMSVDEIRDKLQLHEVKDRRCFIQGSSAVTGDGLYDGLEWLHSQLTGKAMKESMSKPLMETRNSVRKAGFFSSIYNSLSSYWPLTGSTSS